MDVGSPKMETIQTLNFGFLRLAARAVLISVFGLGLLACSTSKVMEDKDARFTDINEEFGKVVQVKDEEPKAAVSKGPDTPKADVPKVKVEADRPVLKPAPSVKVIPVVKQVPPVAEKKVMKKREPDFEDAEGFDGRRPLIEPFRENEKVVYEVTHNFLNAVAGELSLEVMPHQIVNERKSYHYMVRVKTSKMFSSLVYGVDNFAETFVDYETLVPMTYSVTARETKRLKEGRTFFDWTKNEATMWEKVVKKGGEEKKKKKIWSIEKYTQNVISAVYYLRNFKLVPGKTFQFRVADDGKNYTFKGEVLRTEKLDTALGKLDTVVVRPNFSLEGEFKPAGDNLIWLTNDDRKFIVRIQSKVKIGSVVAVVKSIKKE
jgi:hypothetical protein